MCAASAVGADELRGSPRARVENTLPTESFPQLWIRCFKKVHCPFGVPILLYDRQRGREEWRPWGSKRNWDKSVTERPSCMSESLGGRFKHFLMLGTYLDPDTSGGMVWTSTSFLPSFLLFSFLFFVYVGYGLICVCVFNMCECMYVRTPEIDIRVFLHHSLPYRWRQGL